MCIRDRLRVADAAGVCSVSASHFMRWFRQMTGQSFIAFLKDVYKRQDKKDEDEE